MKLPATIILGLGLAVALAVPHSLQSGQSQTGATNPDKTANTPARPSSQDIANAKSQGLVWADASTHLFYKNGVNYGRTKGGKFITEVEARQQGFRAAKESANAKPASKKKDQSGLDDSVDTHSSTPPKQ